MKLDISEHRGSTHSRCVFAIVTVGEPRANASESRYERLTLTVGATRQGDTPWPEPRCNLNSYEAFNSAQWDQLYEAIQQLFRAYRQRFPT